MTVDWNARYAQPSLLFGEEPSTFLRREARRLAPGGRVLCVADGECRNGIWLAEQGYDVVAFDSSSVAIEKARQWAGRRGAKLNFHVEGVDNWDWQPAAFDVAVAIFVQFADPETRRRLFTNMWMTLKQNGLLLIQGYTPKQLEFRTGGPSNPEHLYTEPLLRELLPEADWLMVREYEDDLHEGSSHSGRSALIEAVVCKPFA